MKGTLTPLSVLAVALTVLSSPARPADAEADCYVAAYTWELELARVESESSDTDLQAIAAALGSRARMRGGYRDPARPRATIRAEFVGSTDGAGLTIALEKSVSEP